MLVICLLNNIVLRGRGFCTSSIAQITGNVPRLLADIVDILVRIPDLKCLSSNHANSPKHIALHILQFCTLFRFGFL